MKDLKEATGPQVFTRVFGTGPRQVLAVHCSLAHSGTWRGLQAAMSEEITITAFDMLQHGRSPDWDGKGDYQDQNVEAGLPLLTEPMDLIGHSFGGTVALRMALRRPDLVRSVTLIEPVLFSVAMLDAPAIGRDMLQQSAPFREAYDTGDHEQAARLFNRAWSSGAPSWADLPVPTRQAMIRAIPVVRASDAAVYHDRSGILQPGVLDRLTMPVLLLRGSKTHPAMQVVNDGLVQRLPDGRSEVVQGAGHMVPISHPAETAARLRAFWAA